MWVQQLKRYSFPLPRDCMKRDYHILIHLYIVDRIRIVQVLIYLGKHYTEPAGVPDIPGFRMVDMYMSCTVKSEGDKIYSIWKEQACSCPLKCFYCSVFALICTPAHVYTTCCTAQPASIFIYYICSWIEKNIQPAPKEQTINCGELPTASTNSEAFDLLTFQWTIMHQSQKQHWVFVRE